MYASEGQDMDTGDRLSASIPPPRVARARTSLPSPTQMAGTWLNYRGEDDTAGMGSERYVARGPHLVLSVPQPDRDLQRD